MKAGERVQVAPILGPTGLDGSPAEITGVLTGKTKAHGIVKLTAIPQGVRMYVTGDGHHHIIADSSRKPPPKDSHLLQVGDESAFAFEDLCSFEHSKRTALLTLEQAREQAGAYAPYVDSAIESGTIKPTKDNLFFPADVDTVVTCCKNVEGEQQRSGQHQERLRLARNYVNAV